MPSFTGRAVLQRARLPLQAALAGLVFGVAGCSVSAVDLEASGGSVNQCDAEADCKRVGRGDWQAGHDHAIVGTASGPMRRHHTRLAPARRLAVRVFPAMRLAGAPSAPRPTAASN